MNTIKAFLAKYPISSHTVALVAIFFIAAFTQVQQFHDLVMSVYNAMPKTVQELVVTVIALIAFYKNWKVQPPAGMVKVVDSKDNAVIVPAANVAPQNLPVAK